MSAALSHRFASLDGRLSGSFAQDSITSSSTDEAVPMFGPSLLDPGELGTPMSADHTMASQVDTEGLQAETHSCQHCEKQFNRLCDLNKHAKSHSRPFKCAFQNCKYWSLGWPTAKELERHVNDKHSAAPQTYPCLFQHCSYRSKRESNCKQHMEKTHGWRYVRSKSNGRRVSRRVGSQLAALQTFLPTNPSQSFHQKSSSFKPSPRPAADDFVLFPHGRDYAPSDDDYDHDGFMDLDDGGSQGSDVVIPWTSPDTRLRRRETFLQKFTQKFNKHEDDPPIDPQLSSVGGIDTPKSSTAYNNLDPASYTAGTARNASTEKRPISSVTAHSLPSTPYTMDFQQRPGGSVPPVRHGRSSSVNMMPSAVTPSVQHAISRIPKISKRKEEEDPEDEHPQKKFKPSPKADFKDNQMPDIFVAAHPEVYNRNTKPLYQSCETAHKDISTLVRHLSRAPHRLECAERYIHSFDVIPVELSHTKRGVCRRCWEVFTNHDAFISHISAECEKVSKGKREKWRILYDSFTPLSTDHIAAQTSNVAHHLPLPNGVANNREMYGADASADEDDDSPVAPPSPTTVDLGPRVPLELEGVGEIEKLRKENRQLKAFARVVIKQINQARGLIDLSPLVAIPSLVQAIEGSSEVESGADMRLPGRITFPANLGDDHPDPASLVGHMNSQPTDVDAQGMMDDIQQTLSRTSSGMSGSDRSTIRHVSNSPRQPFEVFAGDNSRTPNPRSANPNGGPTPTRHQPTSLPDSGYGSDKKRNSVAGQDLVDQTEQAYPQPRHAIVPIPRDQVGRPDPSPPFVQGRADQPGQQPGHPIDVSLEPMLPSSGMSPDLFTTQDDADAYYLSKDLMEQFGGYSQPSSSSCQS
ncbi:hypothetical protein CONLIGDRAFT_208300 [Coniochaeta ligniaria NRRL 30616]|uniref:C2H2-type domain-containing protein n=1 Tax=Coniochaeta ligniaria NRRL 30616 TaxID=1408157 RepID=A0A1J7JXC9_9PEZI|nr:hypothetical protein CONLIGDRAFT_208300 [Coniochaeta ligniaria NRRL 30616]